jgi:hypothetical protein
MASATALICWDAADVFAMGVQLQAPDGRVHSPNEELVELDTGYTGEVLAPWRLYVALELYGWEVAEELWSEGISVTGETFPMPLSEAILRVPKLDATFSVQVDTFEDNDQFLIGRAFLRKHRLLLDGPASRVCIIPSAATTIELP